MKGGLPALFSFIEVNMEVRQIINRAFMQIGDTLQESYTPYLLLEYYNEGNHLLNALIGKYCPSLATETYESTGTGSVVLPSKCISVLKVTADNKEVEGYHVLNLQKVVFDADSEQTISVDFIKTAGYTKLSDETDLPAELETLLVDYIVSRVMNIDISGVSSNMISALQTLNDSLGDANGYVITKGYWDYDCTRTDYSN